MGKKRSISTIIMRIILLIVAGLFVLSSIFVFVVQTKLAKKTADNMISVNIADVDADVKDASDANILRITDDVNWDLEQIGVENWNTETFTRMANIYNISEIHYIDKDGIIQKSNVPELIGFDMSSGEQSAEFLIVLNGKNSYVQEYQERSFDDNAKRKYAAVASVDGGMLQVGYDGYQFQKEVASQMLTATANRHIGENGYLIICDEKGKISSNSKYNADKSGGLGFKFNPKEIKENEFFEEEINNETYMIKYGESEGYYILGMMPKTEVLAQINNVMRALIIMEFIIFAVLFIEMNLVIKSSIVNKIKKINSSLRRITDGDLNEVIDVRSSTEFDQLSTDINKTVDTLKASIADVQKKMDEELGFAKTIQHSALPNVFPPFPNRTDFDIYAQMDTAKEVGGDFYDFYLLGEDKLAFLVADVSGKGIPAALFMMTAKTLLKSLTESGMPVNEVFIKANNELCKNNEAGMFVTAWMGILDTKTGALQYANAGHNPPVILKEGTKFEFLKSRPGFVLAGMEGVNYRLNEIQLSPGDTLYLYTDGVTEATNKDNELYGDDRLLEVLNGALVDCSDEENKESISYNPGKKVLNLNTLQLCKLVKSSVDEFAGEMPQFDDITMFALKITGEDKVLRKEIVYDAVIENIPVLTAVVDEILEKMQCPLKAQTQVDIAIDELFGNIAKYAYDEHGKQKTIRIRIEAKDAPPSISITFIDSGVPYDPLKRLDPDTTLSAEDREIGGLGIFMVKKSMDEMVYSYKNSHNILKIVKRF